MPKRQSYDIAIAGMGTMGSFVALELVDRGASVIGLDRFRPPHGHGSHSGQTRVFRIAYPEGSGYVPLAQQAGALWDRLNARFGVTLLHRSGMLYMGPDDAEFLDEIRESARLHRLPLDIRNAWEVRRDFPAFQVPDHFTGILDPQAGWLDVDASISRALADVRERGADLVLGAGIIDWRVEGSGVVIRTESEQFRAGKLILCAGAWTAQLLAELRLPITIRRKVLAWFDPLRPDLFRAGQIPVFAFPDNFLYGFPNSKGTGVKLAEHWGGVDLSGADDVVTAPGEADIDPLRAIASKYMPDLMGHPPGDSGKLLNAVTCLYSLTPDEDFIVDFHPDRRQVIFAAGFSGHGFKFAPLIGKALADLALDGETALPIGFLRLARFSTLLDPAGQR